MNVAKLIVAALFTLLGMVENVEEHPVKFDEESKKIIKACQNHIKKVFKVK